MKTVRFILAMHNHQPVGNFHHVFEKACARAYHPFLDVADEYPDLPMVLHFSGPLIEWIDRNDRALAERLRAGVRSGRFELLGGGFGEPIFAMLPQRDVAGQVRRCTQHLARRYGAKARGIWLTERIWESWMASALAEAGIEYTVVDDFHFLATGLREQDLAGYYIVEDQGRLLRVFSGSEFLRYVIPFGKPADTLDLLKRHATEEGDHVVVYADDGEKFGLWPKTYEHVYESGWLRDFFKALNDNRDWIRFTTFAETTDTLPPKGRIYLPDASYREMTEWALHVPAHEELIRVQKDLREAKLLERCRPFLRGSTWRNFKSRYVEGLQMYARMMEASAAVADRIAAKHYEEARDELYRAQCNCAYWHGVFAGLYMPFLRSAVYEHLLAAEALVAPKRREPVRLQSDFDFDALPEIKLADGALIAYFKPDRGGALYELDHVAKRINVTAVMTRRREAYHARLIEAASAAAAAAQPDAGAAQSIHDRVRWKEPGLEKLLFTDDHVRDSFVDRFYSGILTPDALRTRQVCDLGDFAGRPYALHLPRAKSATVVFERTARAGGVPVQVQKRISLDAKDRIEGRWALLFPEGAPPDAVFGVEFNLTLSALDAPDRNFFSLRGENLNNLTTSLNLPQEEGLILRDEWLGLELRLRADPAAGFITYPIETVNDSEDGFERIRQGTSVLPYWRLEALPGEERLFTLTLEARTL